MLYELISTRDYVILSLVFSTTSQVLTLHFPSQLNLIAMPRLASRDVQTTLNHFTRTTDGAPPYHYTYTPPAGQPSSNTVPEAYPVTVHDARGREHEFSTDVNGFAFVKAPAKEKLFEDGDAVTNGYYQEVEELLKRELDAKHVVVFDHTIRCVVPPSVGRHLNVSEM
jgi:hypothetical protein